jgi:threonine synthase
MFTTGEYRVEPVRPSLAPSMDIQVASNFERFLYYSLGRDGARVGAAMREFGTSGRCVFPGFDRDTFSASRCTDAEIPGIIRRVFERYGYIIDPHTACAFQDGSSDRPTVALATASPAKFPDTIREAIGQAPTHPSLEALKSLPIRKTKIAATVPAIKAFIREHAVTSAAPTSTLPGTR